MKRLIGKIIKEINWEDDKLIKFTTDTGDVLYYDVYSDCCSNSWIESIEDVENIIGQEVTRIEEKKIFRGDKDDKGFSDLKHKSYPFTEGVGYGYDDCLDVMNYEIWTNKGFCVIDFRNVSNGYYGGYLEFNEKQSVIRENHES